MNALYVLVSLGCVYLSSAGPGEGPICYECRDVKNPDDCLHVHRCHHEEVCFAEIKSHADHGMQWSYHCRKREDCRRTTHYYLFGRKKRPALDDPPHEHHEHHDHHTVCSDCCDTDGCNTQLCRGYQVQPPAPPPPDHMCYQCSDVVNPDDCTHVHKCGHDEVCSADKLYTSHGEVKWDFHCRKQKDCFSFNLNLFGRKKRQGPDDHPHVHHEHHDHHTQLLCSDCCDSSHGCNRQLCSPHHAVATTPVPTPHPTTSTTTTTTSTTTTPTTTPTTTAATTTTTTAKPYSSQCRDREEDGFSCAMLDMVQLCSGATTLSYVLAHEKCPRHCGICTADPNVPPSVPNTPPSGGACMDYEQDGFKCASLDLFDVCHDPSTLAYILSHNKCRKHCGFCSTSGNTTTASPPSTTTITTTTSTTPAPTTTTTTTATTTIPSSPGCKDVEDNGFSCAFMDALNICTSYDATMSVLAHAHCSKHCGFCV